MPHDGETDEREKLRIVVPPKQSKERLDVYLTHQVENATRNKVQQAIEAGLVLVNGRRVKPSHAVAPGEVLDITLSRPPRTEAIPENIPLEIVYEDDQFLIVNKPAGMVTHPAYGNYTGTLVNALLHYCNALSNVNTPLRPGIVHRLDKETTGLMVVAKNDVAYQLIAKQFSKRTIDREYWAIVWGKFKERKGTIEASLGRSKRDRKKVTVTVDGKHAVTEYEVLKEFEFLSLLRLKLRTGRTHQIRVHLAHIGHPVFGDPTYAGRSNTWGGLEGKKAQRAANLLKLISRQALHAKTIGFVHPTTKKEVKFDSELPDDMRSVLERLEGEG
ncbi:MAG: RluA family pseudouridine synthase [Ignavibacteriales bacterium]|nr:RluA family pseudouridine synthase [Ignavibacteriales bacterium]